MSSDNPYRIMSPEECQARLAAGIEFDQLAKKCVDELQAMERAASPAGTISREQVEQHQKTLQAHITRLKELMPLLDPATLPDWLRNV